MVCVLISTNSTGIREIFRVKQAGINAEFIARANQGLFNPFPAL